jgi:hypothetical protein
MGEVKSFHTLVNAMALIQEKKGQALTFIPGSEEIPFRS